MDPTANLKEQLEQAAAYQKIWDECPEDGNLTDDQLDKLATIGNRLAELVEALHGWIMKGGFMPHQWPQKKLWRVVNHRKREKGARKRLVMIAYVHAVTAEAALILYKAENPRSSEGSEITVAEYTSDTIDGGAHSQ